MKAQRGKKILAVTNESVLYNKLGIVDALALCWRYHDIEYDRLCRKTT